MQKNYNLKYIVIAIMYILHTIATLDKVSNMSKERPHYARNIQS